jgi:hypothetical protein
MKRRSSRSEIIALRKPRVSSTLKGLNMKRRPERSEIIALRKLGVAWGKFNPERVEYETTFFAERDNSLKKTWGSGAR